MSMSIDRVLTLRAEILQRSAAVKTEAGVEAAAQGFGATLDKAVASVNSQQATAAQMAEAYERGRTDDLAAVMIERQKSALAFQATLQTRNKLLSAYRDIMNMPV